MGTHYRRALESTAVPFLLAIGACSGSLSDVATATEAGPGTTSTDASVASSTDASVDSYFEASADTGTDASTDAQGDAPASCASPLEQACGDGGSPGSSCMLSWTTAARPANWCHRALWLDIGTGCGGYDFVVAHGRDTETIYYYDASSGSLVGVAFVPTNACVGVNPGVNESDCADGGSWQTFMCSIDGSVSD